MASDACATDIYKCTGKNGTVSYGDAPCPGQQATLLHKETASEAAKAKQERISNALNGLLETGHLDEARSFAAANGADALLQERIEARRKREQEEHQQEVTNEAAAQRARAAAVQNHDQVLAQQFQAVLQKQDAEGERYRAAHWQEMREKDPLRLERGINTTYNAAKNQWCMVANDGSTVCH
ncbi:hypothetical protein DYGSA30_04130 [Dyella sp. GSA-30]|nr:hypothetical protein DYGSA30_04130 [Dyella sp. GSA-30]